jgi:2-polyprenyl-6-methoxyphenol hydroxylase-like FAD-dependent oxidoreductase
VLAGGRRRGEAGWLGLKQHISLLPLAADLEVHLGDGAYVGLCRVDASTVNICGLFRQRPGLALTRETALETYLHASGLAPLAERIAPLPVDPDSRCAVAGMSFGVPSRPSLLQIGDAYGMIPPFTGHGMAMAFQSAAAALDPIARWSNGSATWGETVRVCNRALASRLNRPLRVATWLHPFLIAVGGQHLFRFAHRTGLLPLRTLTAALHS